MLRLEHSPKYAVTANGFPGSDLRFVSRYKLVA
jgi:hypothetical protein